MRGLGLVVTCALGVVGCDYVFRIDQIPVPPPSDGDVVIPPGRWKLVSAGDGATCGITLDDQLFCWGYNGQEQLGIGPTPGEERVPVLVAGASWLDVSVGFDHACGLQTDHSLWCWGNNDMGQLGIGNTVDSATPFRVGIETWSSVVAGYEATCAIRMSDQHLFCWGQNNNGQLGINSIVDQASPAEVEPTISWQAVSVGRLHACGLDTAGMARCWGANYSGEVGDNSTTRRTTPTLTTDPMPYAAISAGDEYTCGVRTDGRVMCWGDNTTGNLGTGNVGNDARVPAPVSSTSSDWAEVRAASTHTCARRTGGEMMCWGDPAPIPLLAAPTNVPTLVRADVAQLSVGRTHTCLLTTTNGLACAGDGSTGQLGDGVNGTRSTPVQVVPLTGTTWIRIEAGDSTTCGFDNTNHLACWGDNLYAQAADATNMRRLTPVLVNDQRWQALSLGRNHGCAIENDASATTYCWGANLGGSIGNSTSSAEAPTAILTSALFVDVQAGDHTCARENNGTLWCWGTNDHAEAGQAPGTTTVETPTVPLVAIGPYRAVATGWEHTCVIANDASFALSCFGSDQFGQVGDGNGATDVPVTMPATVPGMYSSVVAGPYRTCAAAVVPPAPVGRYMCWGDDLHGELLGNGATADQAAPTAAIGSWKSLALGGAHTCGIKLDDTLWCWGSNRDGQLGNGTLVASRTAVLVGSGSDMWRMVTAGERHTCAMKMDSTVWCWGSNRDGQLGAGTGWTNELGIVQ